jgi:hypothetical protein
LKAGVVLPWISFAVHEKCIVLKGFGGLGVDAWSTITERKWEWDHVA